MGRVIRLGESALDLNGSVVTWGVFDGVHIGHKKIILATLKWARRIKLPSVIITFDEHPAKVLYGKDIRLLVPLAERNKLLLDCGVDYVVVIRFTKAFAKTTADEFIRDILLKRFNAKAIIAGFDTAFGRDRKGTFMSLQKLSKLYDYKLVKVAPAKFGNEIVSSSLIRERVKKGDLAVVEKLLGRKISVIGRVVKGKARGTTIGFPTANLDLQSGMKPSAGVYGSKVLVGGREYGGVVNIGVRPTFNGNKREIVEVHILNFNGRNIYNKDLQLQFLFRIRGEKKFSGAGQLTNQIRKDISYYFSRVKN